MLRARRAGSLRGQTGQARDPESFSRHAGAQHLLDLLELISVQVNANVFS